MKVLMNLLSLKTVPTLFWTAPSTFTIRPPFVSVVFLLLGLVIFGLGHAILFASNLGVSGTASLFRKLDASVTCDT